jgi:hypothetical protein
MRGIVIPKEIDYIFQKKKNNSLFSIFSQFLFFRKKKKKPKPSFTQWLADHHGVVG